jgi:hypothetical protein
VHVQRRRADREIDHLHDTERAARFLNGQFHLKERTDRPDGLLPRRRDVRAEKIGERSAVSRACEVFWARPPELDLMLSGVPLKELLPPR